MFKKIKINSVEETFDKDNSFSSSFIPFDNKGFSLDDSIVFHQDGALAKVKLKSNVHTFGPVKFTDHYFFILPMVQHGSINGTDLYQCNCILKGPTEAYHAICEESFNSYILTFKEELYYELITKNRYQHLASDLNFNKLPEETITDIHRQVEKILQGKCVTDYQFKALIDSILFEIHKNSEKRAIQKKNIVLAQKCFSFLWEHRFEKLYVYELCEVLKVSRRSLEMNYKKVFGISIGQHIKLMKLHGIREELLLIRRSQGSIKASLSLYDIEHHGHFSQSYKSFFGETMSQTIATLN